MQPISKTLGTDRPPQDTNENHDIMISSHPAYLIIFYTRICVSTLISVLDSFYRWCPRSLANHATAKLRDSDSPTNTYIAYTMYVCNKMARISVWCQLSRHSAPWKLCHDTLFVASTQENFVASHNFPLYHVHFLQEDMMEIVWKGGRLLFFKLLSKWDSIFLKRLSTLL